MARDYPVTGEVFSGRGGSWPGSNWKMIRRSERASGKELRRATVSALVAACTGFLPCLAQGQAEITAFVEGTGRVVFTNMAAAPAPAPPAPPIRDLRRPAPAGAPYATLIESIAASHGVHSTLVRAVIEVESSYDRYAVSSKNARGLMQLIPETGRRFGVRDFFDPEQNIQGGVRYLRFLLEKFEGDVDLTLAAYNSGENRVERLGRIPYIPETIDYVRKVRAAIARLGGLASPLAALPADGTGAGAPIGLTTDTYGVRKFSNLGY